MAEKDPGKSQPRESERSLEQLDSVRDHTETIDLRSLLTSDLTTTGSFDIHGDIWETTFGRVLQALPIPAFLVDADQNIVAVNQACSRISVEEGRLAGTSFARLFDSTVAGSRAESILQEVFSTRKPKVLEALLNVQQKRSWVRMTLRVLRIMDVRLVLVLIEDLTREKRQLQENQKLQKDLERLVLERTAELETVNRRLMAEIQERTRVEVALRESEQRYRSTIESIEEGYYEVDLAGNFTFVNEAGCKMLGRSREEFLGLNNREYADAENARKAYEGFNEVYRTGRATELLDYQVITNDGSKRDLSISIALRKDSDGNPIGFRGIARDVTERRRSEEQRLSYLRFLESLDKIERSRSTVESLEETMGSLLDATLSIFGCDRAWLMYPCDPEAASCKVTMERTHPEYPGAFESGQELPVTPDLAMSFRAVLGSKVPVVFHPEQGMPLPDSAKDYSIKSSINAALSPRIGKSWMWGLSQCSHPRIWNEEDRRLFQEIGTRIADSLSGLLLIRDLREREEELRRRADELGALNRLGARISAKLSAEETISTALEEVHSSLAPDIAMLFLRDGEDLHLRGMFQRHTPKGDDVLPVHRVGECLCGLAVREGKSIFSYDIRNDPRCTWDECKRAGMVSCAAIPLAVGDEVMGTLAVASATPRDFEARSSFMDAFCHEIAISLKNSVLYEEVQSHAAALETRLIELQRAETEKEKLHEQLVQAQKMEAVGTLAGGIAHDFNNLLQVIVGYSDILFSAKERTDRDSRALSAIRKAATDGAELVKGLLTFSRKVDTNPRPINLNHEICFASDEIGQFPLIG